MVSHLLLPFKTYKNKLFEPSEVSGTYMSASGCVVRLCTYVSEERALSFNCIYLAQFCTPSYVQTAEKELRE